MVSIGSRDLQEIQTTHNSLKEQAFQTENDAYVVEFKNIIGNIRALNKNAQLIIIGSYNPLSVVNASDNIAYLDTWTYHTQLVIATDEKATFIPTYDIFKNNLNRFISSDKLNPNSTGYQTFAYLISKAVENTLSKP